MGRSKQRSGALNAAKISYGLYQCNECKKNTRRKDIEVNHKIAIGKFIDWDTFIERLFCDTSMLEVVCKSCHKLITKGQRKNGAI